MCTNRRQYYSEYNPGKDIFAFDYMENPITSEGGVII